MVSHGLTSARKWVNGIGTNRTESTWGSRWLNAMCEDRVTEYITLLSTQ